MSDADQDLKKATEEVLSVSQELSRLESVLGEQEKKNAALADAAKSVASLAAALQDLPECMSAWSGQAQAALASAEGVVEGLTEHRTQMADALDRIETSLNHHVKQMDQASERLALIESSLGGVERNMKRGHLARLFKSWVD